MSTVPDAWAGLAAVIAAGVAQGSFMLPMKWTTGWRWENTWLVFAFTAYLLCPWLLLLSTVPQAFQIYGSVPVSTLAIVVLFGAGWGIGALTFGLGVAAVGLALGFVIILGLAAVAGTLVPLLLLSPAAFTGPRAWLTAASLVVMLAGVAVCSFAGKWKEKDRGSGSPVSYRTGLIICIISGIFSAFGNLGFVYGGKITAKAVELGVSQNRAPNVVWALLTLALFVCNAGYALVLMKRNGTGRNFMQRGTYRYFAFGALMGVLWMTGFSLYGLGATKLGGLGPSLGWAILMTSMVLTANVLGIATGEWRGAPAGSKRRLMYGLTLLIAAIAGLGGANASGG